MGKHIITSKTTKPIENNSKGKNIFVRVTKEELERLRVPSYPLLIK